MPEGDTIHHAANLIRPVLQDRVPDRILTPHPRRSLQGWPQRLAGLAVCSVDAHGKHLFLRFEEGLLLHSHLRMTGAWAVHAQGGRWRRSPSRAWLVVEADGVSVVQFDGPVLELLTDAQLRSYPPIARLGEDVLAPEFDTGAFLRRLRRSDPTRPVGEALLDQRLLAGIGNVWKSEACFAAGVSPWRPVGEIGDGLALEIVEFARRRMAVCARDGVLSRPKAVYGRRGRQCLRCAQRIRGRGQGEQSRVTFWCPGCQR